MKHLSAGRPMPPHTTDVDVWRRKTRKRTPFYYATCSLCGWKGRLRKTPSRANLDGREHEKTPGRR